MIRQLENLHKHRLIYVYERAVSLSLLSHSTQALADIMKTNRNNNCPLSLTLSHEQKKTDAMRTLVISPGKLTQKHDKQDDNEQLIRFHRLLAARPAEWTMTRM